MIIFESKKAAVKVFHKSLITKFFFAQIMESNIIIDRVYHRSHTDTFVLGTINFQMYAKQWNNDEQIFSTTNGLISM